MTGNVAQGSPFNPVVRRSPLLNRSERPQRYTSNAALQNSAQKRGSADLVRKSAAFRRCRENEPVVVPRQKSALVHEASDGVGTIFPGAEHR